MKRKQPPQSKPSPKPTAKQLDQVSHALNRPVELGGPTGPEPTRYGDWEKKGRCIDF